MIIINKRQAGKTINSSKGTFSFNQEGKCEVSEEQAAWFASMKGFEVEMDNSQAEDENQQENKNTTAGDQADEQDSKQEDEWGDVPPADMVYSAEELNEMAYAALKELAATLKVEVKSNISKKDLVALLEGKRKIQ